MTTTSSPSPWRVRDAAGRGRPPAPAAAAVLTAAAAGPGRRSPEPELMDAPELDARCHHGALRGLARLNWWRGASSGVRAEVAALHGECGRSPLRLLDVASGAGDVPLALWRWARRTGRSLEITGCDRSPTAVEHARARAHRAGAALEFTALDVLTGPLPAGFDVVTASLFLHHLDDAAAAGLLGRMAGAAGRLVVVDDLERHPAALAMTWLASRVLTRSRVVHVDAVRSVRAGFSADELAACARRAGLTGFAVRKRWPFRLVLSWRAS